MAGVKKAKPDLTKKVHEVPHKPGVYLMRDRFNRVAPIPNLNLNCNAILPLAGKIDNPTTISKSPAGQISGAPKVPLADFTPRFAAAWPNEPSSVRLHFPGSANRLIASSHPARAPSDNCTPA